MIRAQISPSIPEQEMNQVRRNILRGTVSTAVLSVAVAAGVLRPGKAAASVMDGNLLSAIRALQTSNPAFTDAIRLGAPDIAENGATVFIDFSCALPDVDGLFVFVDRNPQPQVAAFWIAPEVEPSLQMRIKVSQTAQVWIVARSAGQFFKTAKTVKVTMGGCGVGLN
jgi:sulfur-oxidizing protein SoxY